MSKLDNITSSIKKGVNKGVSVVRTKSKKMMMVTQLNNELKLLQQGREEKVKQVGEKACILVREAKINIPEIRETADAVLDYDRKIDEKKKELVQIRLAAEEANQEQQVKENAPEENCGHKIPEGARFCPVCGRKLIN